MSGGFATIGHSNRPPETVIDMLRQAGVPLLVDVRSFPKSRSNPDFNDDSFPQRLAEYQIDYRHMLALGGRSPKQPGVDDNLNAFWRVRSFHNYADYALGEDFQHALAELEDLGQRQVPSRREDRARRRWRPRSPIGPTTGRPRAICKPSRCACRTCRRASRREPAHRAHPARQCS